MATKYQPDPHVIPECQILHEGGPEAGDFYDNCTKNPGHTGFFTLSELKPEMLPEGWRCKTMMDFIKCSWDLTVKVVVKKTSENRPITYPSTVNPYPFGRFRGSRKVKRNGTGFVYAVHKKVIHKPCPCPECVQSGQPKGQHFIVYINTSSHVIFDKHEAAAAVFHFDFHADDDRENTKHIYGIECRIPFIDKLDNLYLGQGSDHNTESRGEEEENMIYKCLLDRIEVACVTHDKELASKLCYLSHWRFLKHHSLFQRLKSKRVREKDMATGIIISHPHGKSKKISIGQIRHRSIPNTFPISDYQIEDEDEDEDRERVLLEGTKFRLPLDQGSQSGSEDQQSNGSYKTNDASSGAWPVDISPIMPSTSGDLFLTPGTKNSLPFGIKIVLRREAPFFLRSQFGFEPWYIFPLGTVFENHETGEPYNIPSHAEFLLETEKRVMRALSVNPDAYYLTYDIPTCPGSSGAGLLDFSYHSCPLIHEGALTVDAVNKSGVHLEEEEMREKKYFLHLNQDPYGSGCVSFGPENGNDFDENELLTDDMLLHLYDLTLFTVDKIIYEDDNFLGFTRWRVRQALMKSILRMIGKHRTVSIPVNDDDDDDDSTVEISKIDVSSYRLAKKTHTDKFDLVKILLVIEKVSDLLSNDRKDDDVSETKTSLEEQLVTLFWRNNNKFFPLWVECYCDDNIISSNDIIVTFLTEKMFNLCNSCLIDADRDDNVDDNMNIEGSLGSDSVHDKMEKRRRWSLLLEELIDHQHERRLIELYAKEIDLSFSLSQNDDDDVVENITRQFRQKRYDSMTNRENEWRQIEYFVNKYDTDICFWENDDDVDYDNEEDDDDDDDDDYYFVEKNCKLINNIRASIRRKLFDKLSRTDAGELDWKEIRCWETIVSPSQCPEDSETHGLTMTFLMDEKFQQAARYVLGVGDVSLPIDDGELDYPLEVRIRGISERLSRFDLDVKWTYILFFMSCMPDVSFKVMKNRTFQS